MEGGEGFGSANKRAWAEGPRSPPARKAKALAALMFGPPLRGRATFYFKRL